MFKFIIVLSIVDVVVFLQGQCDAKPIAGGELVNDNHNYKFMVSLQELNKNDSEYKHFCGGSLIRKNWLISAAHCVHSKDPNRMQALVGEMNLYSNNSHHCAVTKIYFNNFNKFSLRNDIALIQLNCPESFDSSRTGLIRLPDDIEDSYNHEDLTCKIFGYGATEYAGEWSNTLKTANINIIASNVCTDILGWIMAPQEGDNAVCALGNKADTCQGDSGGPLVCVKEGTEYLFGITSRGIGCATKNIPSVYALVRPHLDWILNIINAE